MTHSLKHAKVCLRSAAVFYRPCAYLAVLNKIHAFTIVESRMWKNILIYPRLDVRGIACCPMRSHIYHPLPFYNCMF